MLERDLAEALAKHRCSDDNKKEVVTLTQRVGGWTSLLADYAKTTTDYAAKEKLCRKQMEELIDELVTTLETTPRLYDYPIRFEPKPLAPLPQRVSKANEKALQQWNEVSIALRSHETADRWGEHVGVKYPHSDCALLGSKNTDEKLLAQLEYVCILRRLELHPIPFPILLWWMNINKKWEKHLNTTLDLMPSGQHPSYTKQYSILTGTYITKTNSGFALTHLPSTDTEGIIKFSEDGYAQPDKECGVLYHQPDISKYPVHNDDEPSMRALSLLSKEERDKLILGRWWGSCIARQFTDIRGGLLQIPVNQFNPVADHITITKSPQYSDWNEWIIPGMRFGIQKSPLHTITAQPQQLIETLQSLKPFLTKPEKIEQSCELLELAIDCEEAYKIR